MGLQDKCMIEKCYRPQARRGLCLICYNRAKNKVEACETTWNKLVELGLCKDETEPFDAAYNRAMKDQ